MSLSDSLKSIEYPAILSPVPDGSEGYVLSEYQRLYRKPLLVILRDDKRMQALQEELAYFAPSQSIFTFPAWDCLPYDRVSPGHHIVSTRMETLCQLLHTKAKNPILLTTLNAALQRIPPKSLLREMFLQVEKGASLPRSQLIETLMRLGYMRSATANESGEFAVRGSIVDIVPSGSEQGYRIDFFGDEVESIRQFDPLTQMSQGKEPSLSLYPASECLLSDDTIKQFRNSYRSQFGVLTDDPLYDAVKDGRCYAGMEHWLPLFYAQMNTVFDYLPDATVVTDYLLDEAAVERQSTVEDYYQSRKMNEESGQSENYHPIPPHLLFLNDEAWKHALATQKRLSIQPFHQEGGEGASSVVPLPLKAASNYVAEAKTLGQHAVELFKKDVTQKTLIAAYSEGSLQRLKNILSEHEVQSTTLSNWKAFETSRDTAVGVTVLPLEHGFQTETWRIVSEAELLGERVTRKASRKRGENFLSEASTLSEGDIVVHQDHGIGRFLALETLTVSGSKHDCLKLEYHGGDFLYVPVENIEILSRYGEESEHIRLDTLGAASWQSRKAKLKKRIRDIANDLMKVAAERQFKKAEAFESTAGMYDEFCARFPYAETDDQLRCIEDVENDLSSGRPMDRLICGDVGFGKTEVALRAAFIAASADQHPQVAVIAPTTLLVRQHYKLFKERFEGFPFEIRALSRMTPPSEVSAIKEGLANGKVDIVIGTHALLAKSILFKRLGLVIVDEEQLFGVVQKERLKQFRANVHMLTLSATPIPRTLQMSLTGIKDLSLIATPPVDRLAIRTFTMPFDKVVIRNALLREFYRGGRIFFVVPRLKDLDEVEPKLKALVPEISMARAHGKLSATELDETMNAFHDGKYHMLLSTNIIGSGIDIPMANTMIIYRADMFGLAQLYQMRGRVGRGKIRGYAYFTTNPRKLPSATAVKRLEVIHNLDSLGAGFTLASHDMDIRGCGNLLGEEQSGQIKEVGVELYQEMLQEAIASLKENADSAQEVEHWTPSINLGIPVLIPEEYVADLELRLGLYRRIATAKTIEELEELSIEMIDRFGSMPEGVDNLLEVMKIKQLCYVAGVDKVDAGPKGLVISFYKNQFKNPETLLEYISKNPFKTKLRGDQKIVLMEQWKKPQERIEKAHSFLEKIAKMAA